MANYRDDLESARLRAQTLEAKVAEREAELVQRDASLAARDAELAELKAQLERNQNFADKPETPEQPKGSKKALIAVAAMVLLSAVIYFVISSQAEAERERSRAEQAAEEVERERRQEEEEERRALEREKIKAETAPDEAEREKIWRELDAERANLDARATGTLNVNCRPPSQVVIDGKTIGKTPITGHKVMPGTHLVRCINAEKGGRSQSVAVKEDETKTLVLSF